MPYLKDLGLAIRDALIVASVVFTCFALWFIFR